MRNIVFGLMAFLLITGLSFAAFTVTKNGATIGEPYSYFGDIEITHEINATITAPTSTITCTLVVASESTIAAQDKDYVAWVKVYSVSPGPFYTSEQIKITYLYEGQSELRMTCVPNAGTTSTSVAYVNKIDKWFIIFLLVNFALTMIAIGMLNNELFSRGPTMMYASIIAAFNLACLGATTSITLHSMSIKYIIGFLNFVILAYTIIEVVKEAQKKERERMGDDR